MYSADFNLRTYLPHVANHLSPTFHVCQINMLLNSHQVSKDCDFCHICITVSFRYLRFVSIQNLPNCLFITQQRHNICLRFQKMKF